MIRISKKIKNKKMIRMAFFKNKKILIHEYQLSNSRIPNSEILILDFWLRFCI